MAEPIATEQEKVAWYNVLGQFRQKVAEFEAMLSRLQSQKKIAAKDPKLAQQYSQVMNSATALQQKIRQIRDATAAVVDWFKGIFTFDGATGDQSFGIVPLIPIAVVAGSIAAISKWVKDAYVFSEKLDKVEQLEKQGIPTQQAINTVRDMDQPRSLFGIDLKWIVIGGIALVVLPPVVRMLSNNNSEG